MTTTSPEFQKAIDSITGNFEAIVKDQKEIHIQLDGIDRKIADRLAGSVAQSSFLEKFKENDQIQRLLHAPRLCHCQARRQGCRRLYGEKNDHD